MCGKVDCKDHTPEQREAVNKFEKLILTNVQEAELRQHSEEELRKLIFGFDKPTNCLVYDPPPASCAHEECKSLEEKE